MSESKPALRNKIAQLRATFIDQLPARIAESRRFLAALQANPDDREAAVSLHRFLHSIKGTGNSFGFRDIGAEAGHGEHLAGRLLETPINVTPPLWSGLDNCLANIEMCVEVLQDIGVAKQQEEAPTFEMPPQSVDGKTPGGRLIYVCDDEATQLEQLSVQLHCFGYQTVDFTDPVELLEAVQYFPIQV